MSSGFSNDLTLAVRSLRRNPGFAAIVVLTLAVGIGANATIFSFVNAFFFKPAAVGRPETLVRLHPGESTMSWPNYDDLRRQNTVFTAVAAHRTSIAALDTADAPLRLRGELTSANFFDVLEVAPSLGRTYSEAESRRDLVVLANHVWRARFGSDTGMIGRIVTLSGQRYEVAGIMPANFRGAAPPGLRLDFWLPVDERASHSVLQDRQDNEFDVIARLKPQFGREQAAAAMDVLARQMVSANPEIPERFAQMELLKLDGFEAFRGMSSLLAPVLAFLALMTVVSLLVLVIGCANIAGLLIARSVAKRRDIGIRLALGAGKARLVRQSLAECLVLSLMGGAAGMMLSSWMLRSANALLSRLPAALEFDLRLDYRVLLYTFCISTVTALLFGALPAWRAAAFDIVSTLKEDGRVAIRQPLRRALVVGQVAACTLLLVWSGLFLRSLGETRGVDPGFDASGVVLATMELGVGPGSPRSPEAAEQMLVELQQRVTETRGAESAGIATVIPLALMGREDFDVWPEGATRGTKGIRVVANRLTPGWFETMRIPLIAGRDFTWNDRAGTLPVVMVNETLARRLGSAGAEGRRILVPGPGKPQAAQIIGVVRDSKYLTLGEAVRPTVYLPFRQNYFEAVTLYVRTADMKSTASEISREMRRLAPGIAVDVYPMTEAVAAAVLPARIGAACTAAFGVVAMMLSSVGIYGLISFLVAQRTREIGIRKAIGAGTLDVIRLVVNDSLGMVLAGMSIGIVAGVVGAIALGGFIVGVSPADPLTLIVAATVLIAVTLAATAVPAIRALRVNPLSALRQ